MIRVAALAALIVLAIWAPVPALLAAILLVFINGAVEHADRERDATVDLLAPPTGSLDTTADRHQAYGEEGR